uniref:Secreted protein n=1 Tax=Emiliania huxleyi TaxID=2903 RepID=A0A6V2M1R0_EMIHU
MSGMLLAMTVICSTFASSGRLAMYATARPTSSTSIVGSVLTSPFACGTPVLKAAASDVSALPISIWPQAMFHGRPSVPATRVSTHSWPKTAATPSVPSRTPLGASLGDISPSSEQLLVRPVTACLVAV